MNQSHYKEQSRLHLFLGLFILLLVVLRLFAVFTLQIDADERQHFHIAYRLFIGDTLYKDVWEHHGYLFYYLLEPAFNWLPESFEAFSIMRLLLMPVSLVSLWLVYRISRLLFNRALSLLSALAFLLMDIFYIKSLEIRPDVFLLVLFLLAIWFLLLYLRKRRIILLLLSGFFIGTGFWFSVKALYWIFSFSLSIPLIWWLEKRSFREIFLALFFLGTGILLALLAGAVPMWKQGLLPEVWQYTLVENFHFADNHKTSFIGFRNFAFWILSYLGILLFVLKIRHKKTETYTLHIFLIANALILLLVLYLLSPAVYLQSGLPVVALMAPFAGFTLYTFLLEKGFSWKKYTLFILFLFYLIVNTGKLSKTVWKDENIRLKQRYTDLRAISSAEDRILSRTPDYPYLRTALHYSTLVKGIRMQMGKGKYTTEWFEKNLRQSECRIVAEWVDIPPDFRKLIEKYYVPHPEINDTSLFVSGYRYADEIETKEQVEFELIAPGPYQIDFAGAEEILLNGIPVCTEEQVYLPAGRHILYATEAFSHLHLYYSRETAEKL